MDLNQINPVLLLATLTQQIVEQEKELATMMQHSVWTVVVITSISH